MPTAIILIDILISPDTLSLTTPSHLPVPTVLSVGITLLPAVEPVLFTTVTVTTGANLNSG
jgi:hypothetical protein